MAASLYARLASRATFDLVTALRGVASVDVDQFSCDIDDGGERLGRAYGIVRRHDNDFVRQTVVYVDDVRSYTKDQAEILGYIVETPDLAEATNPEADYFTGSGRCGGRIRSDVLLDLAEKPNGIAISLGDELIVHDEFLKILAGSEISGIDGVRIRNKEAPQWHRLRVRRRHLVVDEASIISAICAACRSPLRGRTNLWFAVENKQLVRPIFDSEGIGHRGKGDLLAVSKELGDELKSKSRGAKWRGPWYKGLLFSPLYSKASSRYHVVSLINEMLDESGDPNLQKFVPSEAPLR
jgi:hypothetical protein